MSTNDLVGVAARPSLRRRRLRLAGIVGVSTLLAVASLVASPLPAAYATSYPTWADVVAARQNADAKQAAVTHITGLIAGLNSQLQSAQADADAKGAAAYTAEQTYYAAEAKQQTLKAQVDTAAARAAKSKQEVGEYAAQLARSSGSNGGTTLELLLSGKTAGQLLNDLGAVGQVSRQKNDIYTVALSDERTAKQLTTLASQQAAILETQKKAADVAEALATVAATNLQTAVAAQVAYQQSLTLELAALTTQATMTAAQYQTGVAAAAAAAASQGGAGQGGVVDAQGWALPTVGVITSPWGYRFDPAQGYSWAMHYGDDIADGCLKPIYAAHSGTVAYAGPYSDLGNYILIKDGDEYSTSYGHIANGETFVRIGQQVSAGQNIARTGSTGASTGCHLYFQVMVNGDPVDPVPFMQARGITLG